jgi:hypothetical protein
MLTPDTNSSFVAVQEGALVTIGHLGFVLVIARFSRANWVGIRQATSSIHSGTRRWERINPPSSERLFTGSLQIRHTFPFLYHVPTAAASVVYLNGPDPPSATPYPVPSATAATQAFASSGCIAVSRTQVPGAIIAVRCGPRGWVA